MKLLLALTLAALISSDAFGQTSVVPGNNTACNNGSTTTCFVPYAGSVGRMIPMGFQQITSLGSAASLTVPAGAILAEIACTGQNVNWRDDGTAPTASIGMPLPTNTLLVYPGNLAAIQLIQTAATATCNVSYYR